MMTRQRVSPVEADVHRGKRAWGGRGVGVAIGMVARTRCAAWRDGGTGARARGRDGALVLRHPACADACADA
jgi:hypothetical protein